MTRVNVPDGTTVTVANPDRDPLARARNTSYRFDVLSPFGKRIGTLDGVSSGSIEWDASKAIQGGGKIVINRSDDIKSLQIQVAKMLPRPSWAYFDTDTEAGAFDYNVDYGVSPQVFAPPLSTARNTTTTFDHSGSLEITWRTPGAYPQQAVGHIGDTVAGETYTVVMRVLNTGAEGIYMRVSPYGRAPIPVGEHWQTIFYTFTTISAGPVFAGIANYAAVAGTQTFVDEIALYKGATTGFNGEVTESRPFSWLYVRIRPVLTIRDSMGIQETNNLGVFIPSAPSATYEDGSGRQEVELLDRTCILAQDFVTTTYTAMKGANVVALVRSIIASTGETVGAITDSDETVAESMSWKVGTNKLTIINELLDAAEFMPLWADSNGQFQVQKRTDPNDLPTTYTLLDNGNSVYLPDLDVDRDIYSIPNRVVLIGKGTSDTEAWTVIATNEDPSSPYSYQGRGRWITHVETGVEATSEENLQAKAQRTLATLQSVSATVAITHALLPKLRVNKVVRFRRKPADIDGLFVVDKTGFDFNSTALAKTTLREVIT